jgi:hypothetical protein
MKVKQLIKVSSNELKLMRSQRLRKNWEKDKMKERRRYGKQRSHNYI